MDRAVDILVRFRHIVKAATELIIRQHRRPVNAQRRVEGRRELRRQSWRRDFWSGERFADRDPLDDLRKSRQWCARPRRLDAVPRQLHRLGEFPRAAKA